MNNNLSFSLFLLRVGLGWYFLWAGLTKVFDPLWSAAGFLTHAKTFPKFYEWFASPDILPFTNFLNEWGITLVGVTLLLGIGVRVGSAVGILLMILYYFPALEFPYVPPYAFIVDEHVIYALGLVVVALGRAGKTLGLAAVCERIALSDRYPVLRFLD
jgi:thiosulfate dehydrogenase (quinone) large subunit